MKIPLYVKQNVVRGLEMRKTYSKSERPVLSVKEANEKGVNSGITTGRILIKSYRNGYNISDSMVKRIKSFLQRNMGQLELAEREGWNEDKIFVARLIWGGDRTGRFQRRLEKYYEEKIQ